MALAAWRVSLAAPTPARTWALGIFIAQLALNLAWSWIFFHRHAIGFALAEVASLWLLIGIAILAFSRVDAIAAWLMLPYLCWVSFAAVLNAQFWRLN